MGPIERDKLAKWNAIDDFNESIELLLRNGYITDNGEKLFVLKSLSFSEKEKSLEQQVLKTILLKYAFIRRHGLPCPI